MSLQLGLRTFLAYIYLISVLDCIRNKKNSSFKYMFPTREIAFRLFFVVLFVENNRNHE